MPETMGPELVYLLSQIRVGRKNATTYKELSERTRWNSRAIQLAVEELRNVWEQPICSASDSPAGVYLATSSEELEGWANMQRERARSLLRSSWAVRKIAKKWKVQEDQARRDNAMPGEVTLGL
jgi:hypothetical protein